MSDFAIYPSLKNKTVIVSGGAQGIGHEIVKGFAAPVSYTHLTLPTILLV